MGFDFTPSQRMAIGSRCSSILVSAAAGSGKTRVLTQRLIDRVTDERSPVDIDRFLVITYTRAAAAELRSRIMDQLGALAAEDPGNRFLRRQQNLCYRASIGTIHSFCTDVLRENCHLLGISPGFKVMDEDRSAVMKASVLSKILERCYERIGEDDGFRLLVDTVGAGRDDKRLEETVLSLYEKIRSHPYPDEWAAEQKEALALDGVTDAAQTPWGRELMSQARATAEFWAGQLDETACLIFNHDEKIAGAYGPCFSEAAAAVRELCRAMASGWDSAKRHLPLSFPRLGALRNYGDTRFKELVGSVWNKSKAAMGELSKVFAQDSESELEAMGAVAPAMAALLDLTMEFDKAFSDEKNRRGFLDFSDLEHLTARLFVDRETGNPTPLAVEYSHRFAEIMVDEYQDVNAVQDMIFRAVSRDENNLFMVGDVKQSIYRFRLADPTIFLNKYHSFVPAEKASGAEKRVILLQENFRSRKCILDAVNAVFSTIMSSRLGELDYDEAAALKYGSLLYDASEDVPVEFCPVECSADGEEDDEPAPQKTEQEAEYVARRILDMMRSGTPVSQGSGKRKCRWSDFVILMRSPKESGKIFHRVLSSHGIPVRSQGSGGFFTSLEVTVAMNLLTLIDNPHADVPLISVLRSPVFGFSGDELSAVRAADKSGDFYTAMCAAADSGDEKCRGFLEKLSLWRSEAPDMDIHRLIWRVCIDTGLFAVCSAMADGETRRRNLMRLLQYAQSFTSGGYRGVFRFVPWMRRMAEKGVEPVSMQDSDAVSIITIHKSKGLEFPFVFLCDLAHKFNKNDMRDNVLSHSQLGLGPKYTDTGKGVEYPTIARRAIEQRCVTEMLSEEMRVLYVAMTRAKERLIMTCAWKDTESQLKKLSLSASEPMPPEVLRSAPCFAHWIAQCALLHPRFIKLEPASVTAEPGDAASAPLPGAESVSPHLPDLDDILGFRYAHSAFAGLPSKLTATELKRLDSREDDESGSLVRSFRASCFRSPQVTEGVRLSAAEKGTAAHVFLQYSDFRELLTARGIRNEKARLVSLGRLSAEEAECVDEAMIQRLFSSPLGRKMACAADLKKEFPFTLLADASHFFPVEEGEELLLQGVVDCFFTENGRLTIVDYKTDRVSADEVPARAEIYRKQLETYAYALHRITGMEVSTLVLYFLNCGVEWELAPEA